jgi:hypothetical protein
MKEILVTKLKPISVTKEIAEYMAKPVIMCLLIFSHFPNNFTERLIRVYIIEPEALRQ